MNWKIMEAIDAIEEGLQRDSRDDNISISQMNGRALTRVVNILELINSHLEEIDRKIQ